MRSRRKGSNLAIPTCEQLEARLLLSCNGAVNCLDVEADQDLSPYIREFREQNPNETLRFEIEGYTTINEYLFSLQPGDSLSGDILPKPWEYQVEVEASLNLQAWTNETQNDDFQQTLFQLDEETASSGSQQLTAAASTSDSSGAASGSASISFEWTAGNTSLNLSARHDHPFGSYSVNLDGENAYGAQTQSLATLGNWPSVVSSNYPTETVDTSSFSGTWVHRSGVKTPPLDRTSTTDFSTWFGGLGTTGTHTATLQVERPIFESPKFKITSPSGSVVFHAADLSEFQVTETGTHTVEITEGLGREQMPYDASISMDVSGLRPLITQVTYVPTREIDKDELHIEYEVRSTTADVQLFYAWPGSAPVSISTADSKLPGTYVLQVPIKPLVESASGQSPPPFYDFPAAYGVVSISPSGLDSAPSTAEMPTFDILDVKASIDPNYPDHLRIDYSVIGREGEGVSEIIQSGRGVDGLDVRWVPSDQRDTYEGVNALPEDFYFEYYDYEGDYDREQWFELDSLLEAPESLEQPVLRVTLDAPTTELPLGQLREFDETNNIAYFNPSPDIEVTDVRWNDAVGGAVASFDVTNMSRLSDDVVDISFYWSDASSLSDADAPQLIGEVTATISDAKAAITADAFPNLTTNAFLVARASFANHDDNARELMTANNEMALPFNAEEFFPVITLLTSEDKFGGPFPADSDPAIRKVPFHVGVMVENKAPFDIRFQLNQINEGVVNIAGAEEDWRPANHAELKKGTPTDLYFGASAYVCDSADVNLKCEVTIERSGSHIFPVTGQNSTRDDRFNIEWQWIEESLTGWGPFLENVFRESSAEALKLLLSSAARTFVDRAGSVITVATILRDYYSLLFPAEVPTAPKADLGFAVVWESVLSNDKHVEVHEIEVVARAQGEEFLKNALLARAVARFVRSVGWGLGGAVFTAGTAPTAGIGTPAAIALGAAVIAKMEVLARLSDNAANDNLIQAIDPPDFNYTEYVVKPLQNSSTEQPSGKYLTRLLDRTINSSTITNALGLSRDKAIAAEIDQNARWQANQLIEVSNLAHELSLLAMQDAAATHPLQVLSEASATAEEVRQYLTENQLPDEFAQAMRDNGLSDEQIEASLAQFIASDETSSSPLLLSALSLTHGAEAASISVQYLTQAIDLQVREENLPVHELPQATRDELEGSVESLVQGVVSDQVMLDAARRDALDLIDRTRYLLLATRNTQELSPYLETAYSVLIAIQSQGYHPKRLSEQLTELEENGVVDNQQTSELRNRLQSMNESFEAGDFSSGLETLLDALDLLKGGNSGVDALSASKLTDSANFMLQAYDSAFPTAVLHDNFVFEIDTSGRQVFALDVDAGSSDDVAILRRSLDVERFDIDDLGEQLVTLSVTDTAGQTSIATGSVIVRLDQTPPVAIAKDIEVQLNALGHVTVDPMQVDGGSYDNVGIASLELSKRAFSLDDLGENTVTLNVIDTMGNSSFATATLTIIPPAIPVVMTAVRDIDGHTYHLLRGESNNGITWQEAESIAADLGGHLVTVSDATENTWIRDTFPVVIEASGVEREGSIWIGAENLGTAEWQWANGESVTYENWRSNSFYIARGEYGIMIDDGSWYVPSRDADFRGFDFAPVSAIIEVPPTYTVPFITSVLVHPMESPSEEFVAIESGGIVPWEIDAVQFLFSENVSVTEADLVITTDAAGTHLPTTGFSTGAQIATWSLDGTNISSLKLNLNDAVSSVEQAVKLDGEYNGYGSPSGNGKTGGVFRSVISVLPGDTNRDGLITGLDLDAIRGAFLSSFGDENFNVVADLNNDGLVTGKDLDIISENFLKQASAVDLADHIFAPAARATPVAFRFDANRWDDEGDGDSDSLEPSLRQNPVPAIQLARRAARRLRTVRQSF